MKKIGAIILVAVMTAACNPLSLLNISYEDFDLEGQFWAVSGMTAPYGQQEIGRMHYRDADDNLVPAEFLFSGGKVRVVFPSGAYRTVGYKLDAGARTISFDAPITYGCEVNYNGNKYIGQDIKLAKYEMMSVGVNIPGQKFNGEGLMFSFFDTSAKDFLSVDLDKQQWAVNMVNMEKALLTPVYEISGEYGTKEIGVNSFKLDNPPTLWSTECVYEDAVFTWVAGADLSSIHWGPKWRNMSEADAQWLLDNCVCRRVWHDREAGTKGFYFISSDNLGLEFPCGEVGEELGVWLSNGKALVYKVTDPRNDSSAEARIITPSADAKYFLRPVLK